MIYEVLHIKKPTIISPEQRMIDIRTELATLYDSESYGYENRVKKCIEEFNEGRDVTKFPEQYRIPDESFVAKVAVSDFLKAVKGVKSSLMAAKRRLGWVSKLRWLQLVFNSSHGTLFVGNTSNDDRKYQQVDITGCKKTQSFIVWCETFTLSSTNMGILDVLNKEGVEFIDIYVERDKETYEPLYLVITDGKSKFRVRCLYNDDLYKEEIDGI